MIKFKNNWMASGKTLGLLLCLMCFSFPACEKEAEVIAKNGVKMEEEAPQERPKQYLALGDSYTIGQSVDEPERFPEQLATQLRADGISLEKVRIIAQTGWTTTDLQASIPNADLTEAPFDIVTLLIGVNNQYQGRSLENYREEFEQLLIKAIQLTADQVENVIVLSIPDYGVTPFISSEEAAKRVAEEIDEFNLAASEICQSYDVLFLNITDISRLAATDPSLIASDGLHPSGKMYEKWVERMLPHVKRIVE